jgi:hypothetical protein
MNGDPKYPLYRHGKCMKNPVEDLLKASGVDLSNGEGFEELEKFQEYLSDHKIVAFYCLNPDRIMFSGNSDSCKKLYLLYNADTRHYNVISNIKAVMAKKYMCNTVTPYIIYKCGKACSLCTVTPPCTKDETK